MNRLTQNLLILVALLVFAFTTGCTAMQRNAARKQYIYDQLHNYKYQAELDSVWPQAREMLFERGYQTRDSGGGYNVETEWAIEGDRRHRYLLTGLKGPGTAEIHFMKDSEAVGGSVETGRDYEIELLLVKRIEPQRAAQIEAEAEAHANKVVPE